MNARCGHPIFTRLHGVSLRTSALLILCFAGGIAAFAQSTPFTDLLDRAEQSQRDASAPPSINFEGEWRYDYGNPYDPKHAYIRLEQQDSKIKIFDLGPGNPPGGRLAFLGTYSGNLIDGTGYPPNRPPASSTMRVQDPDTLIMPNHIAYHRNILTLKDVPCDEQNSFHVNDDGVKRRLEAAIREKAYPQMFCWAVIAGNKDDNDARYLAGMMLYKGIGVAQSYDRAFPFIRAAAIFANQDAALLVADMYDRGQGTPVDPKQAVFWRGRAATLRHIEIFQELTRQSAAYQDAMNSIFGWVGENCGMSISQSNAWENNVSTRGKDPCANGRRW